MTILGIGRNLLNKIRCIYYQLKRHLLEFATKTTLMCIATICLVAFIVCTLLLKVYNLNILLNLFFFFEITLPITKRWAAYGVTFDGWKFCRRRQK